jgi:hypothetical protein
MNIIAACKYGVHDISRTELDKANSLPRFNMPLELGLDLGCRRFGIGKQRSKRLLVLDKNRYRYQKFISDIAGQDITPHSNSAKLIIRQVRDWLSLESKSVNIPGGSYIYSRYLAFHKSLPILCKNLKLNSTQLTFGDFSKIVRVWLEENET